MPFIQRVVDPINLSQKPLEENVDITTIFVNVSNNTLCCALKQLASVVSHADDIFLEIFEQFQAVKDRTENLQKKVNDVDEKVKNYNPKLIPVPECDLNTFGLIKKHYVTKRTVSENFFTEATRTRAVRKAYEEASKTPLHVIKEIDILREDGLLSSSLFICTPVVGQRKRQLKNLEIESRKPKKFSHLQNWNSDDELLCDPLDGVGIQRLRQQERANSSGSLHKLPSPQERAVAVSLKYPSSVISVDVSGTGFQRMTQFRRSLIHFEFSKKKKKKRSKRRNTIAGIPDVQAAVDLSESNPSEPQAPTTSVQNIENDNGHMSLTQVNPRTDPTLDLSVSSEPPSPRHNVYETIGLKHRLVKASVSALPPGINVTVKLRENVNKDEKEENRSSSGNWSGSGGSGESSTRTSLESDSARQISGGLMRSSSHNSLGRDSALSDGSRASSRASRSLISTSTTSRWLNSLDTSYSSDGSERTLTPEATSSETMVDDLETGSAHSCDTEGYYTSFHSDSGLRLQDRALTGESEYELFGRGSNRSTDTTNSSTSTVVMNLSCSDDKKRIPPAPPPRGSSLERRRNKINKDDGKRASVITVIDLLAEHAGECAEEHKDDSSNSSKDADSGRETSSSPCVTERNVVSPELEFSESDLDGPERQERLRVKTVMNTSRIPSMCVITPPQSDEESGKSDIISPNDPNSPHRLPPANQNVSQFVKPLPQSESSQCAGAVAGPLETHFGEDGPAVSHSVADSVSLTPRNYQHNRADYVSVSEISRVPPLSSYYSAIESPVGGVINTKSTRAGARITLDSEGKVVYSSDSLKRHPRSHTSFEPGPHVRQALPVQPGPTRSTTYVPYHLQTTNVTPKHPDELVKNFPSALSSQRLLVSAVNGVSKPIVNGSCQQDTSSSDRRVLRGYPVAHDAWRAQPEPSRRVERDSPVFYPCRQLSVSGKIDLGYRTVATSRKAQPAINDDESSSYQRFSPSTSDLEPSPPQPTNESQFSIKYKPNPNTSLVPAVASTSPGTPSTIINPRSRYPSQCFVNGLQNDNAYQQKIAQFQSALPEPQLIPEVNSYQVNSPKNRNFRLFETASDVGLGSQNLVCGSLGRRQVRVMKRVHGNTTPLRTSSPLSLHNSSLSHSGSNPIPFPGHLDQSPVQSGKAGPRPLCHTNSLPRSFNRSRSPGSDSSISSIGKKKCSMTSEEIYAATHRSKKKLGIRSDCDFSSSPSPTSTRSNSPSLSSTSSLVSLNSVSSRNSSSELMGCMNFLTNKRNSWSPDTCVSRAMLTSPTLSEPGHRHSVSSPLDFSPKKIGPKNQTSMMEFKKLLLKHKTENKPKISAVELLKASAQGASSSDKTPPQTPSKSFNSKTKNNRPNPHSLRYPSASLRALLMSPGTDVISMPIMEEFESEKDQEENRSALANGKPDLKVPDGAPSVCSKDSAKLVKPVSEMQLPKSSPPHSGSSHIILSQMEQRNGSRRCEGVDDMAILSVLQSIRKAQSTLAAAREAHSSPKTSHSRSQSPMETSL